MHDGGEPVRGGLGANALAGEVSLQQGADEGGLAHGVLRDAYTEEAWRETERDGGTE